MSAITLICGSFFLEEASHSLMIFPQRVHRSSSEEVVAGEPEETPLLAAQPSKSRSWQQTIVVHKQKSKSSILKCHKCLTWKLLPEVTEIWEVSEERLE